MILVGVGGLMVLGLVAFGWWTIGFPRRRIRGGLMMLGVAFTCSPFILVMSGERFGFDGVVAGLVGLFCVVAGGFFFLALGWIGRPQKIRKVRTLSEDPDLF
ncbi:hypothetical protein [Exiguobacterium sp. TNDT2]|uniref:hypothetical protein n=1 Tax=Exiguobacterium sp. TNDT2 TaxID=2233531 RepID=UPI0013007FD2|nr:hypothetical protein [Exiguobacterium sp. TNDT2]